LKPEDASKDDSDFAEAETTLIQYIHFALEENVIHQRSKPEDPSMESSLYRFGPPIVNPHRHRLNEEVTPRLHIGDNKGKA
jgi:hypothetical protein